MLKLRHSPESRDIYGRFYGGASLYTSPYKRLSYLETLRSYNFVRVTLD